MQYIRDILFPFIYSFDLYIDTQLHKLKGETNIFSLYGQDMMDLHAGPCKSRICRQKKDRACSNAGPAYKSLLLVFLYFLKQVYDRNVPQAFLILFHESEVDVSIVCHDSKLFCCYLTLYLGRTSDDQ